MIILRIRISLGRKNQTSENHEVKQSKILKDFFKHLNLMQSKEKCLIIVKQCLFQQIKQEKYLNPSPHHDCL